MATVSDEAKEFIARLENETGLEWTAVTCVGIFKDNYTGSNVAIEGKEVAITSPVNSEGDYDTYEFYGDEEKALFEMIDRKAKV